MSFTALLQASNLSNVYSMRKKRFVSLYTQTQKLSNLLTHTNNMSICNN